VIKRTDYQTAATEFGRILKLPIDPQSFCRLEGDLGDYGEHHSIVPPEQRFKAWSRASDRGHVVTLYLDIPGRQPSLEKDFSGYEIQFAFDEYNERAKNPREVVELTLGGLLDMIAHPENYCVYCGKLSRFDL
jgi:hypothetical protein